MRRRMGTFHTQGGRQHGYHGLGYLTMPGGMNPFPTAPKTTTSTPAPTTTSMRIAPSAITSLNPISVTSRTALVAPTILRTAAPAPAPAPTSSLPQPPRTPSGSVSMSVPTPSQTIMGQLIPSQTSFRQMATATMPMAPYTPPPSEQAPASLPQAMPGAFQQASFPGASQSNYGSAQPSYVPPVAGAMCPQGFVPGRYPGTCFPVGDNPNMAAFMSQNPVDALVAAQMAMNTATVPRVNVNVSSPEKAAAEAAEEDLERGMAPAPQASSKTPLLIGAAGLLALLFLK